MLFELPHYALELLVVLPLVQARPTLSPAFRHRHGVQRMHCCRGSWLDKGSLVAAHVPCCVSTLWQVAACRVQTICSRVLGYEAVLRTGCFSR